MLKDRRTYEIMRPEEVGVTATLVLGKHSGRHAVQRRCEQIGHTLDGQALDRVYVEVIAHADREKVVNDSDLTAIVARVTGARPGRQRDEGPPESRDAARTSTQRRPKSATATESSIESVYSTVTLFARLRG